ncbi:MULTISPECIES: hypothetical protein [Bacillus]|uniref:hypothetical protein n=1 Tax=Bacillus TaxID=1386 RepID=UPI0008F02779|nr:MULTISPECIES: hypothetical protein [Bacillus]MDZ4496019.1 hypothetical protein [Bacillus cereus]MED2794137.1 hypothetical protein [Bacillus wiedmannii]PGL23483.1 hypothetical protein CN917_02915 [Bacillus thuringiensis]SFK66958.1 hypothetical protein SAMN04488573_1011031 [Bacillus sp. 5mfcol3.1]
MVACKNEKDFKDVFEEKFGEGSLSKGKTFKNSNVNISVDASINYGDKTILIEIDSGNYAKLLVGQYVLLNELLDKKENIIFLIIHYYDGYKSERTKKNLDFINNRIYEKKGLRYYAYTKDEFSKQIRDCTAIEELFNVYF